MLKAFHQLYLGSFIYKTHQAIKVFFLYFNIVNFL
jgi:hypothetical protein